MSENLTSRVLIQANRLNPEVFHRISLYDRVALTQMFESLLQMGSNYLSVKKWDKMEFSASIKARPLVKT
jgi:hypothetical protein